MNILALDTATPACTVSLLAAGQVYSRDSLAPRGHAALVLTYVDEVLQQAGLGIKDIDLIACGVGPGSFMGVRLAVSVAQGLAYARTIPVVAISTLQTLAQTAYGLHGCERVITAWDARMQEVYLCTFAVDAQGIMRPLESEQLLKPATWLCQYPKCEAVGNAWEVYRQVFSADQLAQIQCVHNDVYPAAKAMLTIAQGISTDRCTSAKDLAPVYLRAGVND